MNDRGELVGINTAILSHGSGGNEGIGFAIPINLARNVMGQIIDHGKVTRGYIGVVIQPITPNMSKALNLDKMQGALVGDVSPKGPAKDAGVQRGDVILAINGNTVNDQQRAAQHDLDDAAGAEREADDQPQRQHEGHRRETR